jgi:hypothetical protein
MTNPADRFAIIPLSHGPAPPDAIAVGSMSAVMEHLPDTIARQDAITRLDKARMDAKQISRAQNVVRALQVAAFCDSVAR